MTNAELEELICGLHRRIALTTAGTPLQDDLIKAAGALRIAVNRIAELEKQVEAYQKLAKRCGKQMRKMERENDELQDNLREKVIMLQRAKEGYVDAEN